MYKHEEVAQELVHEISVGATGAGERGLPAGARLPSETELAARHRVSVPTVRRALATLAQARIVSRAQGQGTFVSPDGPERASNFRSPLERLFSEAAANAADTAITHDGRTWFHPQGPLAAGETLQGNRAVQNREAAHYELLGRVMKELEFSGTEYVNAWVATGDSRVHIEWYDGSPLLDEAVLDVMPYLPHNEGGIPGLRVLQRAAQRVDLFWIMYDPPIHLALRRQDPVWQEKILGTADEYLARPDDGPQGPR